MREKCIAVSLHKITASLEIHTMFKFKDFCFVINNKKIIMGDFLLNHSESIETNVRLSGHVKIETEKN